MNPTRLSPFSLRFGVLDAPTVQAYVASSRPRTNGVASEKTTKANGFVLSAVTENRGCCVEAALLGLQRLQLPLQGDVFEAMEKSTLVFSPHVTQLALLAKDGWPKAP